jgi:hypothetical protein
MARCAERDALDRVRRVGSTVVVGRDQRVDIDEGGGVGRLAGGVG